MFQNKDIDNVIFTGITSSNTNIATANTFISNIPGTGENSFLTKILSV